VNFKQWFCAHDGYIIGHNRVYAVLEDGAIIPLPTTGRGYIEMAMHQLTRMRGYE